MKIIIQTATYLFILSILGCSSSTGSRYVSESNEKEVAVKEKDTPPEEETNLEIFDMTPYHSSFDFKIKEKENSGDIWYGFDSSAFPGVEKIITDKAGYRVEVFSTDNLEEANNLRSELRFKLKQNVYIIFDPPFYRVRTGDYVDRGSAENQSFKLKQLGYQESRVVSDSIKVAGIQ